MTVCQAAEPPPWPNLCCVSIPVSVSDASILLGTQSLAILYSVSGTSTGPDHVLYVPLWLHLDTRWFPTRAFSIRIWRIGYYHILCCQNANSTPSCHGVWSLIRWMQRPNRMANFLTKQIDLPKTNRQIDSNRESECSTSYLVASLFLLAADTSERWRCTSLLSEYFLLSNLNIQFWIFFA